MAELEHIFITELPLTEALSADDNFIISQVQSGGQYVSKRIAYDSLSSAVRGNINGHISSIVDAAVDGLDGRISANTRGVSALSSDLSAVTDAVVKMANCIQQTRAEVSSVRPLSGFSVAADSGISALSVGQFKWKLRHTNSVAAKTSASLVKVKYDAQGHVTGSTAVTYGDVTGLGSFVTGAGDGLELDGGSVSLKNATRDQLGGVKVGQGIDVNDGVISVDVPVYDAGVGLSKSGTTFNLVQAGEDQLGGVKVGDNLSVDGDGRLCTWGEASEDAPGVVRLGFTAEPAARNYPLQMTDSGAYVHVPWEGGGGGGGGDLPSGDVSVAPFEVISSLQYANGGIGSVGRSSAVSAAIFQLSSQVSAVSASVPTNYISRDNAGMSYDTQEGALYLYAGQPEPVAQAAVPAILTAGVVSDMVVDDGEGMPSSVPGAFLELCSNAGAGTDAPRMADVYVSIPDMVRQLSSVGMVEQWTFTLDDSSTVTKNVVVV